MKPVVRWQKISPYLWAVYVYGKQIFVVDDPQMFQIPDEKAIAREVPMLHVLDGPAVTTQVN